MPPRRSSGQVAFAQKVNNVQSRPQQITPSAQFIGAAMPLVPGNIYGRMGKGPVAGRTRIGAMPTERAYGNTVVRSDPRGEPAAFPWGGAGDGIANASPYPHATVFTPHSLDSAGAHARTSQFQHGRLIARDRHIIASRGMPTRRGRQPPRVFF